MADIAISSWGYLIIMSLVLPTVVGLLTKFNAPAQVKILVNLVVSAVGTLLIANQDATGGAVIAWSTFNMWAIATLISILTYLGVYSPLNLTSKLAPEKGLG